MPELPEVETVLQTLQKQIEHRKITDIEIRWVNIIAYPQPEVFQRVLTGHEFTGFHRLGKYLIFTLQDLTLICHLRMEGKFYLEPSDSPLEKHTHVIFHLDDGRQLRYNDTRKFGKMYLYQPGEKWLALNNVGLDPWDRQLTTDYLTAKLHHKKMPLKQALLDQSIIAGIGNIYADEICFACRKSPMLSVDNLTEKDLQELINQTRSILQEAIAAGGTTIRSYTSSLGISGRFQQSLQVHTRVNQPCHCCQTKIVKTRVAGRGTYYCPHCQELKL
ncbi:Formamidopyrimidine-DNA glycosylase [bioreactor metagenome]|uniref:Formamidopyrimidine-DNA glycosylase n=1 Tax=bioreactor metagenome TaxID=1076179 RepID=A0A645BPE9_9ZZZZ|nr:DNA-formamidopyrimidine glycosylase [Erysipelotrichaceae bacterium]